jgi:hypothetical protein
MEVSIQSSESDLKTIQAGQTFLALTWANLYWTQHSEGLQSLQSHFTTVLSLFLGKRFSDRQLHEHPFHCVFHKWHLTHEV